MLAVWRWNGVVYEFISVFDGQFQREQVRILGGIRQRMWDYTALKEQYHALIVMGQLRATELVAAKVFGFLAG